MTDTTFVDKTTQIVSSWLNDVNVTVYRALGSGGVAPTTAAAVRTNLSVYSHADLIASAGAGYIGFDQSSTYPAGTVGLSLQRFVNVLDAPYNADPTGVADSTAAIQAAITAVEAGTGGIVFLPRGTYKLTASLTMNGASSLVGEYAATQITQTSTSVPAITTGASLTVWNGNHSYIVGIQFGGANSGGSGAHGIKVQAKLTTIRDCTFANFGGSGIWGQYAQHLSICRGSFSTCSRYGIEILTADWDNSGGTNTGFNTVGSNGVNICDIDAITGNTLGGIFAQVQQAKISKLAFLNTGVKAVGIYGYANEFSNSTIEYSLSDAVAHTFIEVETSVALPNILRNILFEGPGSNLTPISVLASTPTAGAYQVIIKDCSFDVAPVTYYVIKADNPSQVIFQNNWFASSLFNTLISNKYGAIFEGPLTYRFKAQAVNSSPNYTSKISGIYLPAYGEWRVGMVCAGINDAWATERASNWGTAHWFNGTNTFKNEGTPIYQDTATALVIDAVDSSGQLEITCTNTVTGTTALVVTLNQIGLSE